MSKKQHRDKFGKTRKKNSRVSNIRGTFKDIPESLNPSVDKLSNTNKNV